MDNPSLKKQFKLVRKVDLNGLLNLIHNSLTYLKKKQFQNYLIKLYYIQNLNSISYLHDVY